MHHRIPFMLRPTLRAPGLVPPPKLAKSLKPNLSEVAAKRVLPSQS